MLTESHHYHDVSSATLDLAGTMDLAGTILPGVRWRAHYFDRGVRVEISDVLHWKEAWWCCGYG